VLWAAFGALNRITFIGRSSQPNSKVYFVEMAPAKMEMLSDELTPTTTLRRQRYFRNIHFRPKADTEKGATDGRFRGQSSR
jgi:hypothetical protein